MPGTALTAGELPDALLQVEALPQQHSCLVPQLLQLLLQLQMVPARSTE